MKKNNDEKMLSRVWAVGAITLAIIVIITIIAVTISIFAPRERTSNAIKYDLNCVTKIGGNPLKDCRIESDKCLIEVDGAPNTYELHPWEDCEE